MNHRQALTETETEQETDTKKETKRTKKKLLKSLQEQYIKKEHHRKERIKKEIVMPFPGTELGQTLYAAKVLPPPDYLTVMKPGFGLFTDKIQAALGQPHDAVAYYTSRKEFTKYLDYLRHVYDIQGIGTYRPIKLSIWLRKIARRI